MLPTCADLELADSRLWHRSTWRDTPTPLKLWPKRGDPLVVPELGLWLKRGDPLVLPAFGLPLKLWLKPPTGRWPERTPAGATIVSWEDGENAGGVIGATHAHTTGDRFPKLSLGSFGKRSPVACVCEVAATKSLSV